jgi:plastocyanin
MKHFWSRLAVAAAIALPIIGVSQPSALAQTAPMNATVTITDGGFQPQVVNVALGGSVNWMNNGANTHSADTEGNAPLPFSTGGLAPGQSASLGFGAAGVYHYTAATDCANGNATPGFACNDYQVVVGGAAAPAPAPAPAAPAPAPAAPAAPAAAPAAGSVQGSATITITDTGISPASVTLAAGGTVTFINNGTQVHTGTSLGGAQQPFDTGGLGAGQTNSVILSALGNYSYTSSPDCINKSNPAGFNCGPYSIAVVAAPAGSTSTSPTTPAAAPAAAPSGQTTVTIDDVNGFTPQTLTVRVGQTVTWTNTGQQVHTATSNPGYYNAFDSGGLGNGQSYSYTFTTAGSYGYHSSTEPRYSYNDPSCACTLTTYTFNGTINVQ